MDRTFFICFIHYFIILFKLLIFFTEELYFFMLLYTAFFEYIIAYYVYLCFLVFNENFFYNFWIHVLVCCWIIYISLVFMDSISFHPGIHIVMNHKIWSLYIFHQKWIQIIHSHVPGYKLVRKNGMLRNLAPLNFKHFKWFNRRCTCIHCDIFAINICCWIFVKLLYEKND